MEYIVLTFLSKTLRKVKVLINFIKRKNKNNNKKRKAEEKEERPCLTAGLNTEGT